MSDVSGIPNLGIPAMGGFQQGNFFASPTAGLDAAYAGMASNNRYFANQQNIAAQNQAQLANQFAGFGGPANRGGTTQYNSFAPDQTQDVLGTNFGNFGQQTGYHSALAAAYGRNTGGFGKLPSGAQAPAGRVGTIGNPSGGAPSQVPVDSSPFDTGNAGAIPYLSGGGMLFGGGGFGGGRVSPPPMQSQAPFQDYGLPGGGGMGAFSPSPNYPGGTRNTIAQSLMPPPPNFDDTFSRFRGGGDPTSTQMQNQPAIDQMLRFNGIGTGVSADAPAAPSSPGADFNERFNIESSAVAGAPGSFADRFAPLMGGNPGTPSQYYTGDRYPGAQAPPPGYQSLFGADNPGGALPVGGFRNLPQPPVMNAEPADDLGPADTLTARDRAIGKDNFGGGFYPTPFNPGQFAPSSPFGSGAGVGGRPGGSGGIGSGVGTQMPNTAPPFFGGAGSGFGAPGSTQSGGLYAGRRSPGVLGQMPGFIGTSQDAYGNPFIQGNAPPYELLGSRLGGGYGIGGLGQGTAFRGVLGR